MRRAFPPHRARTASLLALPLSSSTTANAASWIIGPDGSSDLATIQAGVESASPDDTVVVACGTHNGRGLLPRGGIRVHSEAGHRTYVTIQPRGFVSSEASAVTFRVDAPAIQRCSLGAGADRSVAVHARDSVHVVNVDALRNHGAANLRGPQLLVSASRFSATGLAPLLSPLLPPVLQMPRAMGGVQLPARFLTRPMPNASSGRPQDQRQARQSASSGGTGKLRDSAGRIGTP